MSPTRVRRVLPVAALCLVMLGVVRNQVVPGTDNDLWFHLRFGQELRDGWSIGAPGHLGRFDTADWFASQWLAQLGLAWLVDHGGVGAVLWVVGTLVIALVVVVHLTCRREAAPVPAAVATCLAYVAASDGLGPRPQLLSFVLVAVVVAAWLATVRDGRPRYWLVAVAWLWPMLHGMWPVGILIGAVCVAGIACERSTPRGELLRLAAIPALSLVAAACTPIGLDTFRALGAIGSRAAYFTEWAAPSFTTWETAPLALMAVVVVVDGLRRDSVPWHDVLWIGLALAWALYTVRTGPVAAIMLAPFVARALQRLVPREGAATRRELVPVLAAAAVASVSLTVVAGSRADAPVVPGWVDARLDSLPAGSALLDDWDFGPYLLWRHPDLQVVMHGYGDVFTEEELERNAGIMRQGPGWREDLSALEVDAALLDPGTELGRSLLDDDGWRVVESDDRYVLLEPVPQP